MDGWCTRHKFVAGRRATHHRVGTNCGQFGQLDTRQNRHADAQIARSTDDDRKLGGWKVRDHRRMVVFTDVDVSQQVAPRRDDRTSFDDQWSGQIQEHAVANMDIVGEAKVRETAVEVEQSNLVHPNVGAHLGTKQPEKSGAQLRHDNERQQLFCDEIESVNNP